MNVFGAFSISFADVVCTSWFVSPPRPDFLSPTLRPLPLETRSLRPSRCPCYSTTSRRSQGTRRSSPSRTLRCSRRACSARTVDRSRSRWWRCRDGLWRRTRWLLPRWPETKLSELLTKERNKVLKSYAWRGCNSPSKMAAILNIARTIMSCLAYAFSETNNTKWKLVKNYRFFIF